MVKSLLSLANAFLELLNTPIGTFATQIALLGAAFWGGTGLIKAMGVIPNLFSQFATAAGGAATATTAASGAVAGLGVALKTALPIIGAVTLAIQAAIAIWDAFTVSDQELQESIDTTKSKLSELKTELDTLQSKDQSELTSSDQARLAVLQAQIEANKTLLQQEYQKQYARAYGDEQGAFSGDAYTILDQNIQKYNDLTDKIEDAEQRILNLDESAGNYAENVATIGEDIDEWRQEQAELAVSITDTYDELEYFAEVLEVTPDELQNALDKTEEWAQANVSASDTTEDLADNTGELGESIEETVETTASAIDQLSSLDDAYEILTNAVDQYNSSGQINISTLESLLSLDQSYRDMLVEEDGQLRINTELLQDKKDALVEAYTNERIAALNAELYEIAMNGANSELENSQTALSNSETNIWDWNTAVKNAISSAVSLTDAVLGLDTALGADPNWLGLTEEQEAASRAAIERARKDLELFSSFALGAGSGGSGGSSGRGTSTAQETDYIKEQSEAFKEQNEQLEWNIKMRERQGASEKELIDLYKQLQDQLHQQAEWYRGEGLDETSDYLQETIDGWWDAKDAIDSYNEDLIQNGRDALDTMIDETEQYIDDRVEFTDMGADEEYQIWLQLIQDVDALYEQGLVDYDYYLQKRQDLVRESLRAQQRAEEEAQEAAEEARQAEIDEIERQIDVYETLFDVVARKAQEEIDALNARRDAVEKYYDDQIAALQKTNEELDKEIQKETLLDNLARARQSQVMVYQDGRWQYVQNIDEISEAQAELESYERDQALQQEVDNLNKLKDQALASIDAQIENWERYKEEWESVVQDYQDKQDELLIAQELGIELEGENWTTRLGNLESYVSQYEALMERLLAAQQMANSGIGGGGGGYGSIGGGGGGGGGSSRDRVAENLKYLSNYAASGGDISSWIIGNNGYAPVEALEIANQWRNEKIDATGSNEKKYDSVSDLLEDKDPDYKKHTSSSKNSSSSSSSSSSKPHAIWNRNAEGTLSSPGGVSLVGEEGPELRILNRGDGIIPADITSNLWKWGETTPDQMMNSIGALNFGSNGSTTTITIGTIELPEVKDGPDFIKYMRDNIGERAIQIGHIRR